MHTQLKEWLVRTKTGEILGPFSARDLIEELRKKTFSLEDEIAPSRGLWVSAQSLANHDVEEVTHTSTRNQSYTPTTRSHSSAAIQLDQDELTPTPVFVEPPRPQLAEAAPLPASPSASAKKLIPVLTASVLLALVWGLLLRSQATTTPTTTANTTSVTQTVDGETPFVRDIYQMIRAGETASALKQLQDYHEKHKRDGELEYLIPYSALLILEGDSIARAKKYLEQILSANSSAALKSRAHHWLGYVALANDDGDMGESHFLEALQLNPKDAAARFNLGRAYLKQEKFSQALDYFQLAELEVPDLWLVHIYKGQTKVALGNMEEAKQSFRTAVQSAPDRWLSHIYYGLFLMGVRDMDGARDTLKRMLTKDPHYETLAPQPWGYFQEKTNYTEYLTAYQQIMERTSAEERDVGKLYLSFLQGTFSAPDHKRLENHATKGGLTAKLVLLKVLLESEGKPEDLKNALLKLPANLSEFGYFGYVLRGEAKSRLGLTAEAAADFQKALMLEPSSAAAHFAYSDLLRKAERKEEAEQHLRTLLTYHPNYIPAILRVP